MQQVITAYLQQLQQRISHMLAEEDGGQTFRHDRWQTAHGQGLSLALEEGEVIEKAGVNFSQVEGALPAAASQRLQHLQNAPFRAVGVSVIVHPKNPYVPTSHFNVRYIEATPNDSPAVFWFGGGFDLTPYYAFEEDCRLWHQHAKLACEPFGDSLYPRFKAWADDYFFLPHRQEARGIGGLFFDDFNELGKEQSFAFMQAVSDHYIDAYKQIVSRRKSTAYGERERAFQHYRRGRYVEFNLLYDRGTRFGLEFGGRVESILISLPPKLSWRYNWHPEAGSAEAALTQQFLIKRDWI